MTTPSRTHKTTYQMDAHRRVSASIEIELLYNRCPETSYLEAITEWADLNEIDAEDILKYLADALMQKLIAETTANRLYKCGDTRVYSLDSLL